MTLIWRCIKRHVPARRACNPVLLREQPTGQMSSMPRRIDVDATSSLWRCIDVDATWPRPQVSTGKAYHEHSTFTEPEKQKRRKKLVCLVWGNFLSHRKVCGEYSLESHQPWHFNGSSLISEECIESLTRVGISYEIYEMPTDWYCFTKGLFKMHFLSLWKSNLLQ